MSAHPVLSFLLVLFFVTVLLAPLTALVAVATKRLLDRRSRVWWTPIIMAFVILVYPSTYKRMENYNILARRKALHMRLNDAREQLLACRVAADCDPGELASVLAMRERLYIKGRVVGSTGKDWPNDVVSESLKALCAGGAPIAATSPYLPDAPDIWLVSEFGVSRLCSE